LNQPSAFIEPAFASKTNTGENVDVPKNID